MPVKGLDITVKQLRGYSQEVQEQVKIAVEKTVYEMTSEAQQNAPSSGDPIKTQHGDQKNNTNFASFINFKIINDGFTGEMYIESQASLLAIYIEFGSGASASGYVPTLDPEFQEIARSYFIDGKGTTLARPYFLPAYFKHAPLFVEKVKAILKNTNF